MLIGVSFSIILPKLPLLYAKFTIKLYLTKRHWRDTWRPMDHQRTLQPKTDSSSSGEVVFPSRIFSKFLQYGVSEELGRGSLQSCSMFLPAAEAGFIVPPPRVSGYAKSETKNCVQHFHVIFVIDFQ